MPQLDDLGEVHRQADGIARHPGSAAIALDAAPGRRPRFAGNMKSKHAFGACRRGKNGRRLGRRTCLENTM
jgi:hypothetical protein